MHWQHRMGRFYNFYDIDLTSGFWQMPMGLLGCLASFQKLMEGVLRDIPNVYINDLLVYTDTHKKHLEVLDKVSARLHKNNFKINLDKCVFGKGSFVPRIHTHTRRNQTRQEQAEGNQGRKNTHRYEDNQILCGSVQLLPDPH
jgi:Reverse transcriptase (RNA-dependent DNA polymerase)